MATLDSTAVWDPGLYMHAQCFAHRRLVSNYDEPRCSYLPAFIYMYEGISTTFNKGTFDIGPISLSTMRDELDICENVTESITTLLHIFHVFSVSSQVNERLLVLQELRTQLAKKSETGLYNIFNEYIDQLMTRQSMVTEEDLCIGEIDPYYELQLKLCYGEKLIKQEKYKQYQEFMSKNIDFEMSIIKEMKTRKAYKTMSITCIFLLQKLNIDTSRQQPGGLLKQEELTCLLSDSLSMLPEANIYGTFEVYFEQVEIMNLSLRLEVLSTIFDRIKPHLKLKFMVSYCEHLIKNKHYQLYRVWMVQNLKLFIDVTITVTSSEENRTIPHECDNPCDQINTQWNNEGYKIKKLIGLLSRLLSMLPEYEFDETITYYLLLVKNMKPDINPKYLYSVKTDPHLKLLFKLFWCGKLTNEGYIDSNIVNRWLNDFCRENKAECTAQIINITDNLSEKSLIKDFLQCFLRKKLKTVTSVATRTHSNQGLEQNQNLNSAHGKSKQDLIYAHCACIYSGKKMKNVDIKQYLRKLNMKGPEDENEVEMQSEQVKLLILFILLLLETALGHKSSKLKKYLALKYEFDMACLYLLWCSGDVEVHPGPPWRTKQLEHDSERERKWLQDINSILLKLYWEIPTQSKPKNVWQRKPEHWPLDKPFYDTKNAPKDDEGNKITDDEILTCLLECLKKKNVVIPQIYQSEISARRNKNIQLLHKLQVFRIEMENVKSATLNLYLSNLGDDDVKNLQGIRVNIKKSILAPKKMEDLLKNDKRQKKSAELVAYITRDLASTLCKLARGKDPMKKCDGIWNSQPDQLPKHWPEDVPFFNPCKRGSYEKKDKCSDRKLVDTFLNLQDLKIPQNFQVLVDTYQMMCNSTDNEEKKKNQEKLCRLYTVQSNVEKLDFAIQHLYEESLFLREVCDILNQFWTTQSVNKDAEDVLKNATVSSYERPHTTVTIATSFKPDVDLSNISYTIPIKDAYLQIRCTTVFPNEPSQQHPLTGSFTTANNPENFEDSVLPSYIIDFQSYYDFGNQTNFQNNSLDSAMDEDNGHKTSDLERKGKPLSVTHQYQRSQIDLESLTTHNTLSSDLDCTRCYTEYNTNLQVCESVNSSIASPGENIDISISTSKVKRKQLEDKEEPVKKLMKTKANQFGHYNSTDEEISSPESKNDGGSQEPNHISTSNQHDICSANVQDSPSLEFSLSDIIDGIGDNCNSKSSEESESFQQICDLESINNSNQQDSHENINELNYIDNQMDQTDDKTELEKCLEMIMYLSR